MKYVSIKDDVINKMTKEEVEQKMSLVNFEKVFTDKTWNLLNRRMDNLNEKEAKC